MSKKMYSSILLMLAILVNNVAFADAIGVEGLVLMSVFPIAIILTIIILLSLIANILRKTENRKKVNISTIAILVICIVIVICGEAYKLLPNKFHTQVEEDFHKDEYTISPFNSTYEQYIDTKLSRSSVLSLIDKVIFNNEKNEDHYIVLVDSQIVSGEEVAKDEKVESLSENEDKSKLIRESVSQSKNVRFYAIANKDINGYIDTIKIIPIGNGSYNVVSTDE